MALNAAEIEKKFQKSISFLNAGKHEKARKILGTLLKVLPDNPAILEKLGQSYIAQEKWTEAEKQYCKLSRQFQDNSEILNNYGCVLQKLERWQDAIVQFEKSHTADRKNTSAIMNLGICYKHQKELNKALGCFDQALENMPANVPLRFEYAETLHRNRQFDEEAEQYRIILEKTPGDPKAQIKLALSLLAAGHESTAIENIKQIANSHDNILPSLFQWSEKARLENNALDAALGFQLLTAIEPGNADFWYMAALNTHAEFGAEKACKVLADAIRYHPNEKRFYNTLATYQVEQNVYQDALANIAKLLELEPNNADIHQTYAAILWQHIFASQEYERVGEVYVHFSKAIDLAGQNTQTLHNIANTILETNELSIINHCLSHLPDNLNDSFLFHLLRSFVCLKERNYDNAIVHAQRACELEPDSSVSYAQLAEAHLHQENYALAAKAGERALKLSNNDPSAQIKYGHLLIHNGQVDEGYKHVKQGYEANSNDPANQFSFAMVNLLKGNWEIGWDLYRSRTYINERRKTEFPQFTRWDGSEEFSSLLVVSEQGLGDIIQFARFLPYLAKENKNITFQVRPHLRHLFEHYSEFLNVTSENETHDTNHYSHWAPVGDLPFLLQIPEAEWAAQVPYLNAQTEKVSHWKNRIGSKGFKVGIAWQGNPKQRIDIGRSIPLKKFQPLIDIPGVRIISLQKYDGLDQLDKVAFKSTIELLDDFDEGPEAFSDTIAIIKALDLVIAADTSVAHLAGALGCPVWLGSKHVPDWRWQLDSDNNPWYPNTRLFRQEKPGDWESVMRNMELALSEKISQVP